MEEQYGGSPRVQKQSGNCSSSGPELCLAREELIIEGTCRDRREGNESSIREQAREGVERRVAVICRHLKREASTRDGLVILLLSPALNTSHQF